MTWSVTDAESGVSHCELALGEFQVLVCVLILSVLDFFYTTMHYQRTTYLGTYNKNVSYIPRTIGKAIQTFICNFTIKHPGIKYNKNIYIYNYYHVVCQAFSKLAMQLYSLNTTFTVDS